MRFAIILAILFILPVAYADTIHVPGDHPTIQKAIDAAVYGDTVLVAPNTYYEKIDFLGKSITVTSKEGSDSTILDAIGNGSVVSFMNKENNDAVLDGFTIRNGGGTNISGDYFGGGILIMGASPCINNCIITLNSINGSGGGICILGGQYSGYYTSPLIIDCIISYNSANHITNGGHGGGIYLNSSPQFIDALIHNCEISYNYSTRKGGGIYLINLSKFELSYSDIHHNESNNDGAGLFIHTGYCSSTNYPYIHHNKIRNNTLLSNGSGGGIYISGTNGKSHYIIHNNYIISNNSNNKGGGVVLFSSDNDYTPQVFSNNVLFDNFSANIGGGIYFINVDVEVINCTLINNSSSMGGGIALGYFGSLNTAFLANCILWDNEATTSDKEVYVESGATATIIYSDVEGGYIGTNNIDADPLFVDPANHDYHLTYNSPCMNTGVNSAVVDTLDIDGNPRICDGNVDMGFDEFYTHLYVTGDKTPGGSIEGKLVGIPGTNPVGLFVGTAVLPSYLKTIWGEFWLDAPWFLFGPLGAIPSNGVMVLPTTLPGSVPAPYDVPMQALIGLNADSLTNLCVLEVR